MAKTDPDSDPHTDGNRRANSHRASVNTDGNRDRDPSPRDRDERANRDCHTPAIQHADATDRDTDKRGGSSRPARQPAARLEDVHRPTASALRSLLSTQLDRG